MSHYCGDCGVRLDYDQEVALCENCAPCCDYCGDTTLGAGWVKGDEVYYCSNECRVQGEAFDAEQVAKNRGES